MASLHPHIPISPRIVHHWRAQHSDYIYTWSVRTGIAQVWYKCMSLDNESSLQIRQHQRSYIPETHSKNNWIQQTMSIQACCSLLCVSLTHPQKVHRLRYDVGFWRWIVTSECRGYLRKRMCHPSSQWKCFLLVSKLRFCYVGAAPKLHTKDNVPRLPNVPL